MATYSNILAWENPMDKGAWWATVHGVTKSWTRLSTYMHTHQCFVFHKPIEKRGKGIGFKSDRTSGSSCQLAGSTEVKICPSPNHTHSLWTTSATYLLILRNRYLSRYFVALNLEDSPGIHCFY